MIGEEMEWQGGREKARKDVSSTFSYGNRYGYRGESWHRLVVF